MWFILLILALLVGFYALLAGLVRFSANIIRPR